jgi:hypothetical protein
VAKYNENYIYELKPAAARRYINSSLTSIKIKATE